MHLYKQWLLYLERCILYFLILSEKKKKSTVKDKKKTYKNRVFYFYKMRFFKKNPFKMKVGQI
jgi:hypothetical protein